MVPIQEIGRSPFRKFGTLVEYYVVYNGRAYPVYTNANGLVLDENGLIEYNILGNVLGSITCIKL